MLNPLSPSDMLVTLRKGWRRFCGVLSKSAATTLMAALLVIVMLSGRSAERVGDAVQVLLPVTGLFCAAAQGQGVSYFGRYLLLETGIKLPKFMLGDLPINQRPNGGTAGFPSGHTAAATFGAAGMMQTCLSNSKPAQVVAVMAAGFTGGSRIDASKHNVWQVLAGAVLGWTLQLAVLAGFDRWFTRLWRVTGQRLRPLRARAAQALVTGLAVVGVSTSASAGPEISLYLGSQMAGDSRVSGNDPAGVGSFSFPASWDGKSFDNPPHYGVRATWWRDERFGWALDFNHTKIYADGATLAASGFQKLEFTDGLNNLTFGPMWRWPGASSKLTPYAGLGAGVVIPHVESQSAPGAPFTAEYQLAGPSVAWMAGVSYDINDRWAIFGEYKGTYSWIDADLTGGGTLTTEVDTHAINFGVTYRFK